MSNHSESIIFDLDVLKLLRKSWIAVIVKYNYHNQETLRSIEKSLKDLWNLKPANYSTQVNVRKDPNPIKDIDSKYMLELLKAVTGSNEISQLDNVILGQSNLSNLGLLVNEVKKDLIDSNRSVQFPVDSVVSGDVSIDRTLLSIIMSSILYLDIDVMLLAIGNLQTKTYNDDGYDQEGYDAFGCNADGKREDGSACLDPNSDNNAPEITLIGPDSVTVAKDATPQEYNYFIMRAVNYQDARVKIYEFYIEGYDSDGNFVEKVPYEIARSETNYTSHPVININDGDTSTYADYFFDVQGGPGNNYALGIFIRTEKNYPTMKFVVDGERVYGTIWVSGYKPHLDIEPFGIEQYPTYTNSQETLVKATMPYIADSRWALVGEDDGVGVRGLYSTHVDATDLGTLKNRATYDDPGVEATDPEEGDVTDRVATEIIRIVGSQKTYLRLLVNGTGPYVFSDLSLKASTTGNELLSSVTYGPTGSENIIDGNTGTSINNTTSGDLEDSSSIVFELTGEIPDSVDIGYDLYMENSSLTIQACVSETPLVNPVRIAEAEWKTMKVLDVSSNPTVGQETLDASAVPESLPLGSIEKMDYLDLSKTYAYIKKYSIVDNEGLTAETIRNIQVLFERIITLTLIGREHVYRHIDNTPPIMKLIGKADIHHLYRETNQPPIMKLIGKADMHHLYRETNQPPIMKLIGKADIHTFFDPNDEKPNITLIGDASVYFMASYYNNRKPRITLLGEEETYVMMSLT